MSTWAEHLTAFYTNLKPFSRLPNNVQWLYPQQDPQVLEIVKRFLKKYYDDEAPRQLFLGINPGRFGAGVTGVNFTAPRQLTNHCGIDHPFKSQTELSADFIYDMIEAYGGAAAFYQRFFIGSVCPLGFIRNGKNINYYDDKALLKTVEPFIVENMERLLSGNVDRRLCLCIGGEKNFRYLSRLNEHHHWFDAIEPLPHPRFIMQYRRKFKEQFIRQYLEAMEK